VAHGGFCHKSFLFQSLQQKRDEVKDNFRVSARVSPQGGLARVRYPETVSEIAAQVAANIANKTCLPDPVAIARWCIAGHEWNSFSWKRRYDGLYDRADSFVEKHMLKILEVATRLFVRGIVTLTVELTILSAEPAEKGQVYVSGVGSETGGIAEAESKGGV